MSSETRRVLADPLIDNNPVTLQILGICSALAVTTSLLPSLLMTAAVIAVLAFSAAAISTIRRHIPSNRALHPWLSLVIYVRKARSIRHYCRQP